MSRIVDPRSEAIFSRTKLLAQLYPYSDMLAGKEHRTHFGYRIASHRLRIVDPTIHLVT